MKAKKLFSTISALVLAITVTACSPSKKDATKSTKQASDTVRTIDHAMGKTEIKGNPTKIVVLTNEGTEALLALGVKPVGAAKSWTGNPWYKHIEKDMEGVQNLGDESQINIEAVAALNPDLIIGNKMRHEKIYDQLSKIAPTVYSNTLRGEWKTNLKFYAKVLDKEKEGTEVIKTFDSRAAEIAKLAGDKLKTEVSLVRFMPGKTRIYLGDTFSGMILKQIGFARPETQRSTDFTLEIGKERLKEADGQVMFYFTYETGNGEGSSREKEWLEDPLFRSLNAVKNNKAYRVDDAIWNTAGGVKAANLLLDDIEKFLKENKF
ncbi:iron complex transport system substrate-binding protein [Clostridium tetanomorphum]|uniref:ABC transporter substrate-binding protein n=1 Tax=Clostridium tetanomorphum TaxID=1553 RepID=UPI000452EB1F|nr:iron-siderophore ABC transporter substrate-binding protein [Clostridium tetanomorphum]KAJ52720.1 lipoprotein [Clostridium tetanomorphum DSM 665]MBP1863313.1 iron complex transport system substrate-binding protein [Clostridium tetanomorphum]NRS84421.1 iron complex transport system substrate-binding protein [Clostridium tetanomorphum]SQB92091.1 iron(III) dicitrate ABC transporter [Clostridium tetanomorphum]